MGSRVIAAGAGDVRRLLNGNDPPDGPRSTSSDLCLRPSELWIGVASGRCRSLLSVSAATPSATSSMPTRLPRWSCMRLLRSGINFFDTADSYGDTRSEQFLGRALAGRATRPSSRRSSACLSMRRGWAVPPPSMRRLAVEGQLAASSHRLHRPLSAPCSGRRRSIEDTLCALAELIEAGKVREVGCSNVSARNCAARADAKQRASTLRERAERVQPPQAPG